VASAANSPSATSTPSLAQSAAARITHPLSLTLLVLTFTTGTVDAVSYLGLGHVFTANMTGNVVLLGFGIAGVGGLPVVAPLVSLAAFLFGAALGGILAGKLAARHAAHLGTALAIEGALVAVATILAAAGHPRAGAFSGDLLIALLAFAMGVRNATVRRIAVPDLTTTVLTMTLTGLAGDSPLAGGTGRGTTRRTAAVVTMLAGALAGALMLKSSLVLPLACAAVLALASAAVYPSLSRGEV
jgi:uncharacterized membrane protein YoaK (UPF0700 family)